MMFCKFIKFSMSLLMTVFFTAAHAGTATTAPKLRDIRVHPCNYNWDLEGTSCVRKCEDNQFWQDGKCYPLCNKGSKTEPKNCTPVCDLNQNPIKDKCFKIYCDEKNPRVAPVDRSCAYVPTQGTYEDPSSRYSVSSPVKLYDNTKAESSKGGGSQAPEGSQGRDTGGTKPNGR